MLRNRWNPYLAGALSGLVLILSVWLTGKYFGASTTMPRVASAIEKTISIDINQFEYFTTKNGKYSVNVLPNWQLLFHLGILLGAFLAAWLSGTFKIVKIPPLWQERKGNVVWKRVIWSIVGGAIAIIGARLAGGCPSGHGLSGMAQLSISAFVALPMFCLGGVISSNLLLKRKK